MSNGVICCVFSGYGREHKNNISGNNNGLWNDHLLCNTACTFVVGFSVEINLLPLWTMSNTKFSWLRLNFYVCYCFMSIPLAFNCHTLMWVEKQTWMTTVTKLITEKKKRTSKMELSKLFKSCIEKLR